MSKTNILITGSTGGIGSELVLQLLKDGYELYLPIRNEKKARDLFSNFPNAHFEARNLEEYDDVIEYCLDLARDGDGIHFSHVILLAGDLVPDDEFAGGNIEEKIKASIEYHESVNVITAETVVFGLKKAFGEKLKETVLEITSSWAANFEVGHPYRKNEEGYVVAKLKLSNFGRDLQKEGNFKRVVIEEPALIRSPLTERVFPHLINDPNVEKLEASQYVSHLREILEI